MLRFLVLTLALLNGVYFAWAHGLLLGIGFGPAQQSEPQRLARQIKPDAVQVLTEQAPAPAEPAPRVAARVGECLQAGLFDEAQSALLRSALEPALAGGSWSLDATVEPARWIVYMGQFVSAEALARKRSELTALNLRFEPVGNPALQPGLSLGGFETQAAADAALAALSRRGVRTARVVQERAELRGMMLRLAAVDDSLRARLGELEPALAGKALSPCR